jgi:hypothetical protein
VSKVAIGIGIALAAVVVLILLGVALFQEDCEATLSVS